MRIGGGATKQPKAPAAPKPARRTPAPRPAAPTRPSGGAFVGLDIGTQAIKVVEVRGAGRSLQVTALAMGNTPPGSVQQGIVTDPKALGAAIKQLCQKNGIRAGKVVCAAAGAAAVVVRVIEVPKMTPGELAETMKWEVERHIPFPVNDVEMAYQAIDDPSSPLADPNNPNMEVLLAVAQRDMVAAHLSTLESAGLKPVAIDVEPLAIGRALLNLSTQGLASRNVVVVNIGASNTDVAIFKSGILRFPRTIPIAGDNFTRAIADTLGLTMEQAEEEKRQYATVLMDVIAQANAAAISGGPYDAADAGQSAGGPTPFVFGDNPFADTSVPPPLPDFGITPGGAAPTGATDEMAAQQQGAVPPNPFVTPGESAAEPAPTNPFAENPFADNPFAAPFPGQETPAASAATPEYTPTQPIPAAEDPRAVRRRQIFDALLPILSELAMEVRRSVDYFRSRYPNDTVDQVLLCGGSARIGNIDQFFQSELGVPAAVANPFAGLNVTSRQMDPARLAETAPAYAVALGLAARDAVIGAER